MRVATIPIDFRVYFTVLQLGLNFRHCGYNLPSFAHYLFYPGTFSLEQWQRDQSTDISSGIRASSTEIRPNPNTANLRSDRASRSHAANASPRSHRIKVLSINDKSGAARGRKPRYQTELRQTAPTRFHSHDNCSLSKGEAATIIGYLGRWSGSDVICIHFAQERSVRPPLQGGATPF